MSEHRQDGDHGTARKPGRHTIGEPEAMLLPPWEYPWSPATESGLLTGGRFTPLAAAELLRHAECRTAVVAVGSNASPVALQRKLDRLGAGGEVPFLAATLTGCAVGHSAHVSLPGYVAAAPYRWAGARTPVYVSLLDDRQVVCLDATEPNYERRRLSCADVPLELDGVVRTEEFDIYDSRWGVIAPPGQEPLRLRSQRQLHDHLHEHWPPYGRLLADVAGTATGPTAGVRALMHRLAGDAQLRIRVREALRESGWTRPSGLAG